MERDRIYLWFQTLNPITKKVQSFLEIKEYPDGEVEIQLGEDNYFIDEVEQKQLYKALKLKFEDSHGRIKTINSDSNREL